MFNRDNVFNKSMMRNVVLLFIAIAFIGLSQGFSENIWNNFYNAVHLTDAQRMQFLEPMRETPGLLMMLIIAALSFLTIGRVGTVAMAVRSVGLLCVALLTQAFSPMFVLFMVVVSLGDHIFMPLRNSIGITVANHGYEGRVIGLMDAVSTVLYIAASLPILLIFKSNDIADYRLFFILGSAMALCAAVTLFLMRTHKTGETIKRPKLLFRKKFTIYYIISFISGMRKQIYLLFAPWLLVKTFNQPVTVMTGLTIIGFAAVFFFNPFIGHLIDKYGERKLLVGGGVVCTAVYTAYVFLCNQDPANQTVVIVLLALSFIDRLTQSTLMGRDIFVKHTASSPDEIMPTLSVGVSMDHIASVIAPIFGGMLWMTVGHEWVFAAGVAVAVVFTAMCFLVPDKKAGAEVPSAPIESLNADG